MNLKNNGLSDYLSALIAQQVLLLAEAAQHKSKAQDGSEDLSSLMAYQLFDTLDWARLNLKEHSLKEIEKKIHNQISDLPLTNCDLEHIEQYAVSTIEG